MQAVSEGHRNEPKLEKRPRSSADIYGAGETGVCISPRYDTPKVHEAIQKRHRAGLKLIDDDGIYRRGRHEWLVPYGVRQGLRTRLTYNQIAMKYPFYVTWVSPKTGRRLKKFTMSLPFAIDFVATKAQYVDPEACVVVRHGFYIPTKLMGKFPRKGRSGKTYYWCPRCCQPRRFRRTGNTFYAMRKEWSEEKKRYEWKDRELALLSCTHCGVTNRDPKFRSGNQPVEKRTFKQGARRAKRRSR